MNMCVKCILPVGYPGVKFIQTDIGFICELCNDYIINENVKNKAKIEVEEWFSSSVTHDKNNNYDCALALSGGKDSVATLNLAVNHYKLNVIAFTVDNGFKGDSVLHNIMEITNNLSVDWHVIRHDLRGALKDYLNKREYPCGKECNIIQDKYFGWMAKKHNLNTVISGYELLNPKGKAVIKKDGFVLVNILAAHRLSPQNTKKLAKDIGWKDPSYFVESVAPPGFSDCIAGAVALERIYFEQGLGYHEILEGSYENEFLPYLAQRVRAGLIGKDEMLEILKRPIRVKESVREEVLVKFGELRD